jgi:hypothetical protein
MNDRCAHLHSARNTYSASFVNAVEFGYGLSWKCSMSHLQVFLLGMMVAWTPGLAMLAWLLRRDFSLQQ